MTIETPGVSSTSLYAGATPSTAKKDLDSETFLTLLVAQLKYQDPSAPMDTAAMMAQTTQLASMEQLTAQSKTMSESFALQMRVAAANLIGQQVTYTDGAGETVSGTATAVSYKGSVPTVVVDGEEIALDAVASVTQQTAPTPPAAA